MRRIMRGEKAPWRAYQETRKFKLDAGAKTRHSWARAYAPGLHIDPFAVRALVKDWETQNTFRGLLRQELGLNPLEPFALDGVPGSPPGPVRQLSRGDFTDDEIRAMEREYNAPIKRAPGAFESLV